MMNSDSISRRLAAEAEALLALIDAELLADDPDHPDHIPMLSDEEISAMAKRAFDGARAIVDAESVVDTAQLSDSLLTEILATWTAELGLVSSTRKATGPNEGRLWKVRVTDLDVIRTILGPDSTGPLSVTVSDTPASDGISVTVTLPLRTELAPAIALAAMVDYGNNIRAHIPLHKVDLGEAAAQAGLSEMTGQSTVSTNVTDTYPILTLSVLSSPS